MARNRALDIPEFSNLFYKDTKDCIFISHKNEDKGAAAQIADYIVSAGIDVYLDQNDSGLQKAVQENNNKKIVECIEKGLVGCTHILCLVSEKTQFSWWVPYEIGYAKKSKVSINSLLLKGTVHIPSFLEIENVYRGIFSFNEFLKSIRPYGEDSFLPFYTMDNYFDISC